MKRAFPAILKPSLLTLVVVVGFGLLASHVSLSAADAKKKRARAETNEVTKEDASLLPPGTKLDHKELGKLIDERIAFRAKKTGVDLSGTCSDGEFIRRAYLDIIGIIPPADKVAQFLDSKDPNKRAKLIDELLDNPRYGKFFAEIWANASIPKISNNRRLPTEAFEKWLKKSLNEGRTWDKIVYDIVAAEGSLNDDNAAVTYFVGNNTVDKMTDRTTQLFLGVQLQCAQCHDHPFTDWKQDEYWAMASFFMKTIVKGNPNQAAKKGRSITITENPRFKQNKKRLPKDAKFVKAKFLAGPEPDIGEKSPYRPVLAKWITSKENRFFARAISNKLWYHFFGRGFVNPVDDMHDDNYASHPELLDTMAQQVKANDFDLKYLIRAICNSETYQRSSKATGNNGDDRELFSHALVRQLSPEQLYDSLEQVIGKPTPAKGGKKRKNNNNRRVNGPRDQFVAFFGVDDAVNPLEYQAGIPQALRLMNSAQIARGAGNGVAVSVKQGNTPAEVIEHMYLSTLSRRPTEAEANRLTEYVSRQSNARSAYGDIMWALLNSSEFALNH